MAMVMDSGGDRARGGTASGDEVARGGPREGRCTTRGRRSSGRQEEPSAREPVRAPWRDGSIEARGEQLERRPREARRGASGRGARRVEVELACEGRV